MWEFGGGVKPSNTKPFVEEDSIGGRNNNKLGIAMIMCLGVGVGVQLRMLQSTYGGGGGGGESVKSVVKGIKFADGVIKGMKAIYKLHSPTPETFVVAFKAAKALAKGSAIRKDFNKISKGIKVSEGALSLLKYSTRALGKDAEDMAWYSIIKAYKLSKGAFNVFEGVNGTVVAKGVGLFKGGVDGVGVIIKAKQLYALLVKGFGVAFQVLSEEYNHHRDSNTNGWPQSQSQTKVCLQMGKQHRISCLQNHYHSAKFRRKKDLPLTCMLASSLVSHQTLGFACEYLFYLSVPFPSVRV